jgi:peroxiredoxin
MKWNYALTIAALCCGAASCQATPETTAANPAVQTAQPVAETGGAGKVAMDAAVASFDLPDTAGKTVKVGDWNADGRKATVFVFTSVQCPVSRAYEKRLVALANEFADKGIRFVGINSNKAEASDRIAAHNKQNGIEYAVLKDKGNVIADRFNAKVTPEAYVVDSEGILRYHGRVDDSQEEADVTTHDLSDNLKLVVEGKPIVNKNQPAFGCSIKREGQ